MSINKSNSTLDHYSFDSGENVIYAHDLSGNFTFLNRQGEQLLGYSCEEARHMNITEIIAPEIATQIREQILANTTKRVGTVYEIEVIAKGGQRVPLEVSTSVRFHQGRPAEIEGVAVPSMRGTDAPAIMPRCLDTDFFYRVWLDELA